MESPFKSIRIKGKGEKAKYMFKSQDITEIVKQAQKDIEETRPQIKFEWEDCVAKDGSSFKFSKIQFEGVNFGISLGKALETKENEKFFLWVYRILPPDSDFPKYSDCVWFEDISANNFDEAMEYVESKKQLIHRAMCANIGRLRMFDKQIFDKLRESMEEFIKKQKGNK